MMKVEKIGVSGAAEIDELFSVALRVYQKILSHLRNAPLNYLMKTPSIPYPALVSSPLRLTSLSLN